MATMSQDYTVTLVDTANDTDVVTGVDSYDTLQEAIEAIETLGRFHALDGDLRIELSQGDSVTDWLKELHSAAENITRTAHYWTPDVGDVLWDPEAPGWANDKRVEVLEVTDKPASEYEIDKNGRQTTVADENPSHPEDCPVVVGTYARTDKGSRYAFPVSRLETGATQKLRG